LESVSKQGVNVSTGVPGQLACATIPKQLDDAIYNHACSSAYPLNLGMIAGFVKDDKIQASVLLAYHKGKRSENAPVICPIELAVRRYQYNPDTYDHTAKPSVVAFMTPLYDAAFAPDKCKGNEQQCIVGRITSVRNKELKMTSFMKTVMQEFVELLIPGNQVHEYYLADLEMVMDRQNRPSQRGIIHRSFYEKATNRIKMFMKGETYANVKDPRPISTINGVDKVAYSKVIYSFENALKQHEWYAFSHTPVEIANRVVEVCSQAETVVKTDFSRFDGHVSNLLRELERMALTRAFHPSLHNEVLELHNKQFKLRGIGSFGSRYDSDMARASGSPETSVFNSMENAFIAFLALRRTFVGGAHMDADQAWSCLGIYGGDDGLTANITAKTYASAAGMVGQELTSEIVKRGDHGVQFLSRIYSPNVWFGDNNSICDVKRQLAKLHVTVRLPPNITPVTKLLEKTRAFVHSDLNTPIIGDFFYRANELFLGCVPMKVLQQYADVPGIAPMRRWDQQFDASVQYPNDKADWMFDAVAKQLPFFDYERFRTWLDNCRTLEDIMKPPQFVERETAKSAVSAVVDSGQEVLSGTPGKIELPILEVKLPPPPVKPIENSVVPENMRHYVDNKVTFHAPVESKSTAFEGKVETKTSPKLQFSDTIQGQQALKKKRGVGKFRKGGKYPSNSTNPNWRVKKNNG
jgi:hypothetical protein